MKNQSPPPPAAQQLWAGVGFKLENALFFLEAMDQVIAPRNRSENVALMADGAVADYLWQRRFYANFDAFLAMTRSIADIIQSCFGIDPVLQNNNAFKNLSASEQTRRGQFQRKFKRIYAKFKKLPLSDARNVSLHRIGAPPIDVIAVGFWGQTYNGTPLTTIPTTETLPFPATDDP